MSLAGVILAAGASTRMGSPKALLSYRGQTFLDHIGSLLAVECNPVIAVLGYHADLIRQGIRGGSHIVAVDNPHPELGQFSSLQCGLRAVPESAEGVLFTPVDLPAWLPSTVTALAEVLRNGSARWLLAVPRWQGRRGHPVGVSRLLLPEFLALPPEATARDILHRHVDRTCYVDVEDPGIARDVDDPDSYQSLVKGEWLR